MRTLLLADDNVTVQRVIALTFAAEQVRVVTAADGRQAMERMVSDRPDIVLAGTTLPEVNGYELARLVKNRPEFKSVPVLLLSGAFESVDEALLVSSGANGVIEKPVEPAVVISRVKELLGVAPSTAPVTAAAEHRPVPTPTMPRAVTTSRPMPTAWDHRRGGAAPAVEASVAAEPARADDYLASLDDAFDTLDAHLAGRAPKGNPARNPSPPLGQSTVIGDPRSPGKLPTHQQGHATTGNPVFEVDDDWFGEARPPAETRVEAPPAPREPAPTPEAAPAGPPVFEVDDEWFQEDEKARKAREIEQRELAREMGIFEVTVPEVATVPEKVPTVPEVLAAPEVPAASEAPIEVLMAPAVPEVTAEYEVALDQLAESVEPVAPVAPVKPAEPVEAVEPIEPVEPAVPTEPIARVLPIDYFMASSTRKPAPKPDPGTPVAPAALDAPAAPAPSAALPWLAPIPPIGAAPAVPLGDRNVADDFDALLAFEQGGPGAPPMIQPVIHAVTPEITGDMLDQIAATVAARLKDSVRVEPVAPQITAPMLQQIAAQVAGQLQHSIRVEPAAPAMTPAMLDQIAGRVSERLQSAVRIETVAPEMTPPMLDHVAGVVAGHLTNSLRVEPAAPTLSDPMLKQIAAQVADRLRGSIHVEAKTPELPADLAERVADHLRTSVQVQTVAPEITGEMLEQIASRIGHRLEPAALADHLRDAVRKTVADTIRAVVLETSERLVREEIERIKSKPAPNP